MPKSVFKYSFPYVRQVVAALAEITSGGRSYANSRTIYRFRKTPARTIKPISSKMAAITGVQAESELLLVGSTRMQ